MSLYQRKKLWVLPDDNYAQNKGVEDQAVFGRSVNNNCLNNHQLTPLLSLRLYQRTELWVVPDNHYSQKQGVAFHIGLRAIITVPTIRN